MHRPGKMQAGSTGWTAAVVLGIAAGPAGAQNPHPIPESERWATITHPGNEPYLATLTGGYQLQIGRVDYEYQISRTEVTAAEWLEFVNAYAPYTDPPFSNASIFTSPWITRDGASHSYRFVAFLPEPENKPVEVGWRFAARYCNWLSNGKAMTQDAFESGAYDTSTFGDTPQGFTDQVSRSPGARYWIPSLDELVKASHFDPNRYGPDQPGYWLYSHTSDDPPVIGAPGVGQTNGASNILRDVASYRDVQSPWGLWDTSGGATEWTESVPFGLSEGELPYFRLIDGSSWRRPGPSSYGIAIDTVDTLYVGGPNQSQIGLRLAREIPSPLSAVVLLGAVHLFTSRRRIAHEGLLNNPWNGAGDGAGRAVGWWGRSSL